MINLTIDDQQLSVEEGTTILEAADSLGIKIPTLCYHKALSPYGACRVCVVEMIENGRSKMCASCQYPALEGIVVKTDTEEVIKTRKIMVELLLARCPEAETIKEMAAELGVGEPRVSKKNDDCFLCGMCVRMCNDRMNRAAIGFAGRGSERKVIPPYEERAEICMGCGACEFVCPAQGVKLEDVFTKEIKPI
ncbi:MAG: (2Fe-2S)-binding protein, partial [Thermoplasmata archaeon]|nr:(2Fe-2S)-binding protein [Thermoplasmata archaeon]